jgi:hypothetical protein
LNFPDNFLLGRIKNKHLYRDNRSIELTTLKQKPKNKLAGNKTILENYFFTILTKTLSACKHRLTLTIEQSDWENKVDNDEYLRLKYSYCDLTKFEIIERNDLLNKMRDKDNGFPYVARLGNSKHQKLQNLRKRMHYMPNISTIEKNAINDGLADVHEETLTKLGLK